MSESTEEILAHVRSLISKLLQGSLGQAARDEGIVYTSVLYIEKYQPEWLLDQLREPGYGMAGKCEVLLSMQTHQQEAIEILGLRGTLEECLTQAMEFESRKHEP